MSNDQKDDFQSKKFEALGRFAGGIAHDFNNILSVIEAAAHHAIRQIEAGKPDVAVLQKIRSATQRGAGLTRQLLSFSQQKISLGETIDFAESVRLQVPLLEEAAGENIKIEFSAPEKTLWCQIDSDEVFQILLNLVTNARDALPAKGGVIRIDLDDDGVTLQLAISDNGAGMSQQVLAHIFDPFFTTKAQGKGTGLGLSVVHGIVSNKNGKIKVDSTPGKGTAFTINFPLAEAPKIKSLGIDIKAEAEKLQNLLEGKTILLAEDDEDLRDVLAVMLGDMKMKVMSASNGNEAFQMQQEYAGDIDFLLSDVIMPEMDGVELQNAFSDARPQSNIVLMSGHPFARHREGKSIPENVPLLSKPFTADMVRQVLERALEIKKMYPEDPAK